jgi:hypothetical protein
VEWGCKTFPSSALAENGLVANAARPFSLRVVDGNPISHWSFSISHFPFFGFTKPVTGASWRAGFEMENEKWKMTNEK